MDGTGVVHMKSALSLFELLVYLFWSSIDFVSSTKLTHIVFHGELVDNRNQLWTCDLCSVSFVRRDLWQRHLNVRHSTESTNLTSVPVSAPQGPRHSPDRPDLAHASTPGKGSESSPVISGPSDDWQAEQRGHPQQVPGSWGSNISECADEMLAWQDWLMYEPANSSADSGTDFSWIFGGTQENTGYSELHDSESVIRPLPHNEYPITMAAHAAPDTPSIAEVAGPCFDLELPKCSFRVCRSLTREHRTELLEMLSSDLAYLEPSALSRASLLQGVHLFCRFVSKEVPIVHSYHLIPPAAYKDVLSNQFGLDSPPELMWAVITLGWTVLDRQKYREYHDIARKIQTILRRRIISVCISGTKRCVYHADCVLAEPASAARASNLASSSSSSLPNICTLPRMS